MNLIQEEQQGTVHYHKMADLSPEAICDKLFELGILSVYVEGGAFTIQQFIDARLWDEAFRFVGENNLGNGILAPKINGNLADRFVVERDMVEVYKTL
jgi:diaminohydroxyphosphoribosylaminopyrimidine deaminase/5-amino-6-(5-phosphoribosylamino)uracil reductase